jgi:hypothetical protein
MAKAGCTPCTCLRRLALAAGMVALVCGSNARLAHACSLVQDVPHTLDPSAKATDTTAPAAPTVSVTSIERGKGPKTNVSSCSQSASSCDDLGSVDLQLGAQDDQTPTDQIGYQIELAGGELPSGMTLPSQAVRARAGAIYLHWIDGAHDDQESISFTLQVRAVDLAGNIGPATTVEVHDSGSGGCSLIPSPLSAWPFTTLTILLLAHLLRRRRR